jgi:hypothetical protein
MKDDDSTPQQKANQGVGAESAVPRFRQYVWSIAALGCVRRGGREGARRKAAEAAALHVAAQSRFLFMNNPG